MNIRIVSPDGVCVIAMSEVYHGPKTTKMWVDWARARVKRDDDVILIIEGDTGSAKSSLALLLGRVLQDHPFEVRRQVFWRPEGIIQAARELPEYSVLVLDEAISANRRKAMHGSNIELMEHLNVCRTFHHIVIFCVPQAEDLDISIQTRASWIFSCSKNPRGSYIASEIVGKTRKYIVPSERYGDHYPDPQVKYPELWAEYEAAKKAYSYHSDDPKEPLKKAAIEKYRKIIRQVMQDHPNGWSKV